MRTCAPYFYWSSPRRYDFCTCWLPLYTLTFSWFVMSHIVRMRGMVEMFVLCSSHGHEILVRQMNSPIVPCPQLIHTFSLLTRLCCVVLCCVGVLLLAAMLLGDANSFSRYRRPNSAGVETNPQP
ncbi:unnamed protein product, partial [Pylaiella littoralis]